MADVRVRLSAEGVSEVVSALRKVQAQSQAAAKGSSTAFKSFGGSLSNVKGLLVQVAAAAGVAGATAAFIGLAKAGSQAADQLGKTAQRVGASVENLSALAFAAKTADLDLEGLQKGMVLLARSSTDLQRGVPTTVAAFKTLGLSAKDFKGKDAAEALGLVADKFGALQDSPRKTALAFQIFGRSAANLIVLMNDLQGSGGLKGAIDRARELGVLLSDDTARAAQAINDDFTIIKEQVIAGAARFVEGLAPALHAVLGDLQKDLGKNQDAWKTWGSIIGKAVGLGILTVQQSIDDLLVSLQKLYNALKAFGRIVTAPLLAKGATIAAENALATQLAANLDKEAAVRRTERGARAEALGAAITAGAGSLPKSRGRGGNEAGLVPLEGAGKSKGTTASEARAAEERARRAGEERASTVLLGLDAQRAEIQKEVSAGILTESEGRAKIQAAAKALLPELQHTLAIYTTIAALNPFDFEAQGFVKELTDQIAKLNETIDVTATTLQEVRTTVKESLKGALVDAFTAGIREGLKFLDILRNIALAVVDAVAQLLALKLAESIVSFLLPTPAAKGGLIGPPAPHAEGGFVSGPGSGTSDSIPALLSNGEFVVRQSVVGQPGILEHLRSLNAGLMSPALSGPTRVRRFGDGGLVSGAGDGGPNAGGRLNANITIGLEPGLVARTIESPEGQQAVVRVLGKNRRSAGAALGG